MTFSELLCSRLLWPRTKWPLPSTWFRGQAGIVEQAFVTLQQGNMGSGRVQPGSDSEGDRGPGSVAAMGPPAAPPAWVKGWVPGLRPLRLPADTGYFLPKGAKLLLTIHYRRTGRVENDRTQVKLHFGKGAIKRLEGQLLEGSVHTILPGDGHHHIAASARVAQDSVLYSILPHMHHLGHRMKITLTPPSGRPRVLLRIDDWDFHWQEEYVLAAPLNMKAGSRLDLEAMYDNSPTNPHNPSRPPRLVTYGAEPGNEMCRVFLLVAPEQVGGLKALQQLP